VAQLSSHLTATRHGTRSELADFVDRPEIRLVSTTSLPC
jgi:hypothetical protein